MAAGQPARATIGNSVTDSTQGQQLRAENAGMSDQAQTRFAPAEPAAQKLLSFITAHFAVCSLLGLVGVVLCCTLFLYGYLSVFDIQLIWIIEYPDILKFGLVALALISTTIFLIHVFVQNIFTASRLKGKKRATFVVLIVALAIVGVGLFVASNPSEIYWSFATTIMLLIASSLMIWDLVERRRPIQYIIFIFASLLLNVGSFGGTLGVYTKYSKGGLTHDVFLKDRQMSNVRLVLFTSHHTVLYAGTDVVVLPTSEIMKIVAHPAQQQQRWP